jgi:intracellular sulfur oxidation DsrE/DsrF family protein
MKYFLFYLFVIAFININYSQENNANPGTKITDFGQTYKIAEPDLLLDKNTKYKVIFDVYTDGKNNKKLNSSINTVARFINMHAENGIKPENLDIVLVLHGAATKNALTDKAYNEKFNVDNPNSKLIKILAQDDVKVYVCGQSFVHNNYVKDELSDNVKMSLSALTALVYYQSKGYQLITFN